MGRKKGSILVVVILIILTVIILETGCTGGSSELSRRDVIQRLEDRLGSANPTVQSSAISGLSKTGDKDVYGFLLAKRRQKNFCVRLDFLLALGRMGDKEVIHFLIPRLFKDLHSNSVFLRREAMEHLASIGDKAFQKDVRPLLRDPDYITRIVAADSLAILGDASSSGLVKEGLMSPAEHLRLFSAEATGKLKDAAATDLLVQMVQNDESILVRYEAAHSLKAASKDSLRSNLSASLKDDLLSERSSAERERDQFIKTVLADKPDRSVLERIALGKDELLSTLALVELANYPR